MRSEQGRCDGISIGECSEYVEEQMSCGHHPESGGSNERLLISSGKVTKDGGEEEFW